MPSTRPRGAVVNNSGSGRIANQSGTQPKGPASNARSIEGPTPPIMITLKSTSGTPMTRYCQSGIFARQGKASPSVNRPPVSLRTCRTMIAQLTGTSTKRTASISASMLGHPRGAMMAASTA